MRYLHKIFERIVYSVVQGLPLKFLNNIIRIVPPFILARMISSFNSLKIYKVDIFGRTFYIESGPRDDHYLELEKDGLQNWEHEVLATWVNVAENAEVVVDVGAYLGIYSILAAKVGCTRVIAIEPNSKSYSQLTRNLELNSLTDSVESFQLAVGEESKFVSVITPMNRRFSSGAQISNSPTGRDLNKWEIESSVQMVTLDSLLMSESQKISAIKIDAEGYELFILRGSTKILDFCKPSILIELLTLEQKNLVDECLIAFGYKRGIKIGFAKNATNYFYEIDPIISSINKDLNRT